MAKRALRIKLVARLPLIVVGVPNWGAEGMRPKGQVPYEMRCWLFPILLVAVLQVSCGGGDKQTPNWVVEIDAAASGEPLSPAVLGHYDLSGELYGYAQNSALVSTMQQVGFAEWRVGVGRWEIGTQLLPSLSDGSPCDIAAANDPQLAAPDGATDVDLIRARSWFTDDGAPVSLAETQSNSRYDLGYIRRVIDAAQAFGAIPYLSVDLMPLALSANRTPVRNDCSATFTNAVTNNAPLDNAVFAQAVVGLVQRVVEGSDGEHGRAVTHWEIWNEPEFGYFWHPGFDEDGRRAFFDMSTTALVVLDAYRRNSGAGAAGLRFGLGSFATADVAAAVVNAYDRTLLPGEVPVPLDFISFHAYDNNPLTIVNAITTVAEAIAASTHYKNLEIVLAEWGPDLETTAGDVGYANSMEPPLLMASVLTLGVAQGLDRAHHAIFYDFHPAVTWGLLDNDANPKPLYRAYELLHETIGTNRTRLVPVNRPDNRLGDQASVLVSRDTAGTVRALFINRDDEPISVRLEAESGAMVPRQVRIFDDAAAQIEDRAVTSADIAVPATSLVLAEY